MSKRYQLDVTEKQLQTIATACEVYGRIQYGQSHYISEHIPFKHQDEILNVPNEKQLELDI